MAKNLIPEIARMLGVEIGEEFQIKGCEEWFYKFDNGRVLFKHNDDVKMPVAPVSVYFAFFALLGGNAEIVKLPWKPKEDETFYTFGIHATENKWVVVSVKWWDNVKNLALYKIGWIYRSQAEAEAALPTVAKEMGVEYEL